MGVQTIELGAQSLSDKVLAATARGHSARQVYEAKLELHKLGFEVGLQLMPGLPGDCWETFSNTVEKSIALRPNFVRLYPTVVLANTPLERLYLRGLFKPLSLDEAVEWCKKAQESFNHASIPVIRTGLQPTISLQQPGRIVSGPYHPAFGQLVRSAIWNERISSALKKARCQSSRLIIHAPSHHLPDIRGHKNENIHRWLKELDLISLKTVACPGTREGMFRVTAQ
jgi:histone acetyltransferase (RNA polymerase elongator complex component)